MYKIITGTETDEQILAPVKQAKERLLEVTTKAVADDEVFHSRDLLIAAVRVAEVEAVATASLKVRNAKRDGADVQQVLLGLLVQGADDSWSGRGNDAKRSAHDEVREFVQVQFDHLRYA